MRNFSRLTINPYLSFCFIPKRQHCQWTTSPLASNNKSNRCLNQFIFKVSAFDWAGTGKSCFMVDICTVLLRYMLTVQMHFTHPNLSCTFLGGGGSRDRGRYRIVSICKGGFLCARKDNTRNVYLKIQQTIILTQQKCIGPTPNSKLFKCWT